MNQDLVVVAGGGGFIGGHVVAELRKHLGWEPGISLRDGLSETYAWISSEYDRAKSRA